ncbi:MAG: NAD(P)H-binding protein [Chitinophagales bacterium]
MKLLITGATGMVGSEVVRQALVQNEIEAIFVLTRRPLSIKHQKINEIIHSDFLNYSGLEEIFKQCDACIWALGIPQAWVTKEEYHVITYDYTLAAANAMIAANPLIRFLFVSGGGADSTEKSRITFAREKGKTENALQQLNLTSLIITRPGGIQPIVKPEKAPFSYRLVYPLFPLLKIIMPGQMITSVELAKVILYLVKNGSDEIILENRELKRIYKERRL